MVCDKVRNWFCLIDPNKGVIFKISLIFFSKVYLVFAGKDPIVLTRTLGQEVHAS